MCRRALTLGGLKQSGEFREVGIYADAELINNFYERVVLRRRQPLLLPFLHPLPLFLLMPHVKIGELVLREVFVKNHT